MAAVSPVGRTPKGRSMAAVFKGKLVASKLYDSAKPVKLRFDLTNTGDEDLYVLKWHTPLEGLNSDCLTVIRNEKSKVAYDGPMIKRGHPGPEDYVLIPAGATVTADVDVGESYAVSIPGDYRVELNIQALEHVPAPAAAKKNAMLALPKSTPKLEAVTGGITKFKVKKVRRRYTHAARQLARRPRLLRNPPGLMPPVGQSGPPPTHCPQSLSAARPISKHRPYKPTSTDSIFAREEKKVPLWETYPV